uniref:Uncharacterized protein n=1 Tax=viral metagenome TaxID=1070528 RepID=A0A6M3IM74_9ZZZZ
MSEIIKKLSKEDILTSFHNKHLEHYISAAINMVVFRNKNEDEAIVVGAGVDAQGRPMIKTIKAKHALQDETEKFNNQKTILETIKYLEDNPKEL